MGRFSFRLKRCEKEFVFVNREHVEEWNERNLQQENRCFLHSLSKFCVKTVVSVHDEKERRFTVDEQIH